MGTVHRGNADAHRSVSGKFSRAGANFAAFAVSRGARGRRREPAYRKMDLRAGGEVFHGGGRAGSRSGGRRSRRSGVRTDAENYVHGGKVADFAFAGALPAATRREFSSRSIS